MSIKLNVLVTGVTGFIGRAVASALLSESYNVSGVVRKTSSLISKQINTVMIDDLAMATDWSQALASIDVVIHCAARVHVMNDDSINPLDGFRQINTYASLRLAKQAAGAGVKRFIFLSSIKVNGEVTSLAKPFKPDDDFVPDDPYGMSKYEAEQGLLAIAEETGMDVVIIRPPLVYGPNVRANFASMINWVCKEIPLPLGAIHNKRSFVALDNLVSFIIHCIHHPKAANEVFLVSDGEDITTTQLLSKVAKAFGKNVCLIPVPVNWMRFAARLIGKTDVANRLFGSLQIDSSKARDVLGWQPVVTMNEQLKKMADAASNEKTV
jgi:nucleoside-diphosphate-sugar epimerase